MKVFVGTMESGEADFDACVAAIKCQTYPHVSHFIISGFSEPEAHQRLYDAWEGQRKQFNLFLKIDADTVLRHNKVIADIVSLFSTNPRLTGIQTWLYDYMTDGKIYGLSCMNNSIKLIRAVNSLYPDRVDEKHDQVIRGDALPASLNPAGDHCMHPTDRQAFHYGLHRALKGQVHNLDRVRAAHSHHHDRPRELALLGSRCAPQFAQSLKFNYTDPEFNAAFEQALKVVSC